MRRPDVYETTYANDRRKHRHRCQCCSKIIQPGDAVVMWAVDAGRTRALHAACAGRPSFDGLTQRQLAQLHSDEYARRLGHKVQDSALRSGAIVMLEQGSTERYEVLSVQGDLKRLLRREDLEKPQCQS